jgi:glycosyltransferase involved in cell wall biosynthesis
MNRKKILVKGPAMSMSGYGEQCRFALRSLREYEDIYDIYLFNIGWGHTGFIVTDDEERKWIDELLVKTISYAQAGGQFDMSLQVTIPNEWERIAPINIGYTAGIETTKVSPQWLQQCEIMDKVIVVSNHAKNGFEDTEYHFTNNETGEEGILSCNTPIDVVNYSTREHAPAKLKLKLDYDFNYLTVAQWGPRKNLENTIKWFVEEFIDVEVGLVVKASIANNSSMDKIHTEKQLQLLLNKYPDRKCKVYLIHGDMTSEELAGLYNHRKIKALINLSHGEGFGLPMFEAASHGLPVIAPSWSGQCDFLYGKVRNGKSRKEKIRPLFAKVEYSIGHVQKEAVWDTVVQADSMWCYPEQGSYKMKLRDMYKNYDKYRGIARKLKKHVWNTFTPEKQHKLFAESVLGQEIKNISNEELPKISIITSVYNGDEFIRPFLEDITNQTIFDKCELIMINANSPGNEEAVIKEYMDKHDNIVYKKLDKDPGIYGTWNEALKLSTGEYITNANLDDRKAIWSLEVHAKELYGNPTIDLVYADSYITNSPNETYDNNSSNGRQYNFENFSKEAMLRGNQPHNNPMWRASLHDVHGNFNNEYRSAGDWEFFLRCAFGGSSFKKINQVLGLYYFNPKGISTNFENFAWKQEEEKEIFVKYQDKMEKENEETSVIQSIRTQDSTRTQNVGQVEG